MRGSSTNAGCAPRPARTPRRRVSARPATVCSCARSPRRCSASTRRSNPSPFPRRTRAPARPPDAGAGTPDALGGLTAPPFQGSDDLKKSPTRACQHPQN
ncbi:hypothetical protein F01_240007 [Burkholderia cenocepacia]|nr:hypothetical protein F01_240007 [Burkholderia cenocepacia]